MYPKKEERLPLTTDSNVILYLLEQDTVSKEQLFACSQRKNIHKKTLEKAAKKINRLSIN